MTARSCSGMQRSPPLVLGLFILTLLLLMGCGSGTSTGAPGPPHKVQDPSRMPRRLRRKVELSSAPQLRLDAVSTEERVPHTDSSLRMDLENAGSLLPPSQLQSPTPASEKREERRVDVSLPPPPRSDQNELEEALWSNKLMHRNQIREFQRISDDVHSAIQPRHYAQSSDQDTAGSMGSISVSVFPAPESEVESASLTRRQRSPQTNEDPPRPRQSLPSRNRRWRASGSGEVHLSVAPERERRASGPQLQTDHDPPPAAPAASAPPAPSAPSALPPPSLQLQTAPPQPPAAPQQQRISTRGPSAIQMLARPVATIAAAAVPARSLLPPGQQLPQQPPVLLIFPQRQETTKAPEVTGTPSSAHLTGQAPQQGNGMGGSANMAPPHSSTMTPDEVASTCILALQNALRHVKSQLKPGQQVGQSQQQSQLQTPGQTPNQTQAQGSEAKEQSQEKSQQMAQQITSAQKSQEIGSQHNAEAPLMLTLSRGALSPASGIQSSPASPNTNILLQIELPMGTPSIDGTSQPRPPQIMLAPTPTHLTTHAQEAWMKESLVESKSGLRASFPHLDQRREHDEQRLRRQTVADVGPQNELDADSSASDADDFSSADTIPRSFPRGLVSTPVEGEEHPLRRSMLYPEQLDVRKDTIMTLNAQEPVVHRRRDTGKRRLKKKVLSWNEGTANVELRFIPRAKRPRHRIEVPDTFLPLASELARLGTTRATYVINRDHVWPLFKKVEPNMDYGDPGRGRLEQVNSAPTNLGILDASQLSSDMSDMAQAVPREIASAESPASNSTEADSVSKTVSDTFPTTYEPSDNITVSNTMIDQTTQTQLISPVHPKDLIKLLNMKSGAEKPSGSWQLALVPNTCSPKKPKKKITTKKSTCKKRTTTPGPVTCLESHVREFHLKQHEKYHRNTKQREKFGELLRMITSAPSQLNLKSVSCCPTVPPTTSCVVGSTMTTSRMLIRSTNTTQKVVKTNSTGKITRYYSTHVTYPSRTNLKTSSGKFSDSIFLGTTESSANATSREPEITMTINSPEATSATVQTNYVSSILSSSGPSATTISYTGAQFALDSDEFLTQVANGSSIQTTSGSSQTSPGFSQTTTDVNLGNTSLITNGTNTQSTLGSVLQTIADINYQTSLVPSFPQILPQEMVNSTSPATIGLSAEAVYDSVPQVITDTIDQNTYVTTAQNISSPTDQNIYVTTAQNISSPSVQATNGTTVPNTKDCPLSDSTIQTTYGSVQNISDFTEQTIQGSIPYNASEEAIVASVKMDVIVKPAETGFVTNAPTFGELKSSEVSATINGSQTLSSVTGEATGGSTIGEISASTASTQTTYWTTAETIIGPSISESAGGSSVALIASPTMVSVLTAETTALLVSSLDIGGVLTTETAPATYGTFQISYSTVSQGA